MAAFGTFSLTIGLSGAAWRAPRVSALRSQRICCSIDSGLDAAERKLVHWLSSAEMGQGHLFDGWAGMPVDNRRRLLAQLASMDSTYPEDPTNGQSGLSAYVTRARDLLAGASEGKSPYEGYVVEIPEGEVMETSAAAFRADERAGMGAIQDAVFVLVAGGLGERLGHDGIKVELPAEVLTSASFLQTYISALLAMQRGGPDASRAVRLVIMTSADTHDMTLALLRTNDYFGMDRSNLHVLTQANGASATLDPLTSGRQMPSIL